MLINNNLIKQVSNMNIILASQSPRRSQILNQIRIVHKVVPSDIEENIDLELKPEELVKKIALLKAKSVAKKEKGLIIGADTIVYKDEVLGKPIDLQDAKNMLRKLSGVSHTVYTGIAMIINVDNYKEVVDYEKTIIKMRKISDSEINKYLEMGEYKDAAGSYKIQGLASLFIERIEGCYFNVMGFPIFKFYKLLKDLNIDIWNLIGENDKNEY